MEIYLVRHTKPNLGKSVCYGHADVPLDENCFEISYAEIKNNIPPSIDIIYSSPLQRCSVLAAKLEKDIHLSRPVIYDDRLRELNFGDWELQNWNSINKTALEKWMQKFTTEKVPGGESNEELHKRVVSFWNGISIAPGNKCIVTHAGVIRSILSVVNNTLLENAFLLYPIHYGVVVKLDV